MINLKSKLVVLSMAVSVFASFSVASAKGLLEYKNTKDHYSIKYPDNWEQTEQNSRFDVAMFKSPADNAKDNFFENSNVVVEKAPGYTAEKYYKANMAAMSSGLKGFKIVKSGNKTINGNPSKFIIYTHNYNGTSLRVKAYFFCVNDLGYVVTSTAKDSTFKRYEKQFDEITNTFKTN